MTRWPEVETERQSALLLRVDLDERRLRAAGEHAQVVNLLLRVAAAACLLNREKQAEVALARSRHAFALREQQRMAVRRRIGFIFQSHNLVASLTVLQNVQLLLQLSEAHGGQRERRARELLEAVGLGHRLHHYPDELSGGQRQRIALARAILRKPEILILDESTSQIDMASELQIRETLQAMKGQMTILIITHREALIALADEVYHMQGGMLVATPHENSLHLEREPRAA